MTEKHFILATAGHVDHGKSALVKALTGTDPDRLPEEKARGITIDLGFAHLTFSSPSSTFSAGVVDVPGHEDFVRNMIAGVGSIDLGLLVVAADDGWMPQTEEHLQILEYLGVQRIVVALSKSDLGKIDIVTAQIRQELGGTLFRDCPIVPTSTRTGEGLNDLKVALASELALLPARRDIGKPRLFVDRAFTLRGIGTVVTGTLSDGEFCIGQNVFIQPGKFPARIRSIQTHAREIERALPGMRTAINLPDVAIGDEIERGKVIAAQASEPSSAIDVFLTRTSRGPRNSPMKSGSSAYVHHGTTRTLAKIILPDRQSLAPGERAFAELRLSAPLFAFVGDRFVVRDASEQRTLAGGVVLNLELDRKRSSQDRALITARAANPEDVDLVIWTELACRGVVNSSHLLERSRFSATEIEAVLQKLHKHGDIFRHDQVAAKTQIWRELFDRAAKMIDAAHKSHPQRRGLELNDLRTELKSIKPEIFEALIANLCANGVVRSGSTIARSSHRASLPAQLQTAAEQIRAELARKRFDPPNHKELTQDRHRHEALKFLIEQQEIVQVSEEIVLLRDAVEQMRAAVTDFISTNGPASASQLREKIGTSRRVIIPVLEYFDRTGTTQRRGDQRVLAKKAAVVKITDAASAPQS
jgi:selenocysteine-specific elongation factor